MLYANLLKHKVKPAVIALLLSVSPIKIYCNISTDTLKYRHWRWETETADYRSQKWTIKATGYQYRTETTVTLPSHSLQTETSDVRIKDHKGQFLIRKKAACNSKQEQVLLHAKESPKINRDVTMCCTAVMNTASEQRQIPSPPACKENTQNESTCIRYQGQKCFHVFKTRGRAETTTWKVTCADWMIRVILITPGPHDHQPD